MATSLFAQRLVFTSCIWHHDENVWSDIATVVTQELKPDAFIFLGDTVYNDINKDGSYFNLDYATQYLPLIPYRKKFLKESYMKNLQKQFITFRSTQFYRDLSWHFLTHSNQELLPKNEGGIPGIIGVWDDHDYGYNDAGSWHPQKKIAKTIFENFMGKAPGSNLHHQEEGIYGVYYLGPQKKLQLILLDCRSFKTPHFELKDNKEITILGKKQWAWLKDALSQDVELRIIASSIPVLPTDIYKWKNDQWKKSNKERWDMFGNERNKLLNLITESSGQSILISGDWHCADLSKITIKNKTILEMTAGGWHSGDQNYPAYKGLRKRFKHEFSIESVQKLIPPKAFRNVGVIDINWELRRFSLFIINALGQPEKGYYYDQAF